jgi:LacI family transcriptional regulator
VSKKRELTGIRAIAKEAGVSISTVSGALNNSGNLSSETRRRIVAIATEQGYRPSFMAKNLKAGKTGVVGFFTSSFGGEFYSDLMEGFEAVLRTTHYEFLVCHGSLSQRAISQGIFDGILVLDANLDNEEIVSIRQQQKKVVLLDRKLKGFSSVLLDNEQGSQLAWQAMSKYVPQEINCITGPKYNYDSKMRKRTMQRLVATSEPWSVRFYEGDFSQKSGYEQAKSIWSRHRRVARSPRCMIYAFNDNMALGVYDYAKENDIELGSELLLIGLDGLAIGGYLQPRLTSVTYDRREWGAMAISSLIRALSDEKPQDEVVSMRLQPGLTL